MDGDDNVTRLPERQGPRPGALRPVDVYVMPDSPDQDVQERIAELVPDALRTVADLLDAESEPTRLGAAKLILELAGAGKAQGSPNAEGRVIREQLEEIIRKRLVGGS